MTITEMPQCKNFNCKFHSGGNVSCRLRSVCLDGNGKCVYFEEKELKINIKNSVNIDRKFIRDVLIPEFIADLEKESIKICLKR